MVAKLKATGKAKATAGRSRAKSLEYDATKTTGRRKPPAGKVYAEHIILPDSKRKKLLATVQDQVRNASIAAWMIRRHLDYISKFKFQFRTKKPDLDKLVNRMFDLHARPRNFDVARRFGREEMYRMFELEKVTAGDAGMIKLGNGKLQAIESDLIAFPKLGQINARRDGYNKIPDKVTSLVNKATGVILDPANPGSVKEFCICNRGIDSKQIAFDHLELADNIIFDAYWTRFSSQIRGVSPLTTAINTIQDIYEGVDFNLAKAKVHALFGLAIMRDYAASANDQEEVNEMGGASGVATGATENAESAASSEAGTKSITAALQEIKPNEMMMVDMDLKGKIDTIESKNPSSEFQQFTELVIRLALLALDIPYTAFNSRSASFAGMIADQNMYEVSCKWKRDKNLWKRMEYSDWLIERAWNSRDWNLAAVAKKAGFNSIQEIQAEVEWIPAGSPWLQKLAEIQGDIKAIGIGADNPIDACKRRGSDFFDNIDKTADAYAYAKKKGVPIMVGEPGQASVDELVTAAVEENENNKGDNDE